MTFTTGGKSFDGPSAREQHPSMPHTIANDITIEYEVIGDIADPALLLVMGLGGQLISWPDPFCAQLADRGFAVVRYDNRDVGLSQKFEDAGTPDLAAILGALGSGDAVPAPYTLGDMADDGIALIEGLGLSPAHIVGASMGGMIVQEMVIRHPGAVRSLCSIMSTTGDRSVGQPTPDALAVLLQPPPATRAEVIEAGVRGSRVIGSPRYPTDEAELRAGAALAYDRSYYPQGPARQIAAILSAEDRTAALGAVDVPTLVIHGDADPLVTPTGGEATAKAVPGSELLVIEGMGHDLPEALWPQVIAAIVANANQAA
jgi:pimeloyl-ACP methyl ester carboxylesterase